MNSDSKIEETPSFESRPSRFKESNFRRFEPIIITIMERWPQKSVFKPTNLAVETFAARLRDSVTAFLDKDCLWFSTIDKVKLREIWSKKHVRLVGSTVIICVASSTRKPTNIVYEESVEGKQELKELVFNEPNYEQVMSAVILLNSGQISIPIRLVKPKGITDVDLGLMQSTYPNIQFTEVPDGFMLL